MRDEEFEGLLRSAVRALKEVGEYNQETVRKAAREVAAMNLPWGGVWPSERNPPKQVAARIGVAGDKIAARAIAESGKGKSEEKERACCCC